MHLSTDILGPIVGLLATAVGAWLAHRIKNPTDMDRATLLSRMAAEAAALIVSLYPSKPWAELLTMVVQRMSAAAGIPTKSAQAIENAAAHALTMLGKNPNATGR